MKRRIVTLAGVTVAIAVATIGWGLAIPGASSDAGRAGPKAIVPIALVRPIVTAQALESKIGVRIAKVSVSGGGGLVDLRFQVVDPDLAGAVHDTNRPPEIVDEATGVVVDQLLMGHSHSQPFQAGLTYYLIFENPANWVRHGSKVTVLLGDAQVEHVVVS